MKKLFYWNLSTEEEFIWNTIGQTKCIKVNNIITSKLNSLILIIYILGGGGGASENISMKNLSSDNWILNRWKFELSKQLIVYSFLYVK